LRCIPFVLESENERLRPVGGAGLMSEDL
jgi:hypothetical protein